MNIAEFKIQIKSFKIKKILRKVFESGYIKKKVIEFNQQQLYIKGITARGKIIRTYHAHSPNVYAHRTIDIKKEKGQKVNVVTLKDTGEFYRSFIATPDDKSISIDANFSKADGDISDNVDTTDILGLTDYNMDRIQKEVRPIIELEMRKILLGI